MAQVRNILFIMCDQLRWDYLSCTGHPHIQTPNIDALAAQGVRFDRAFAQSPICGPSRMSFYTGRYVSSHGSSWNGFPLSVGEMTLGDYLRPLGMRTALVGKTHMRADTEGLARLGVDLQSAEGVQAAECGFEPYDRDDGLHPDGDYAPESAYSRYLREHGYRSENPWHDSANSGRDGASGEILSGWYLKNAPHAAKVLAEHSETAYATTRAIDFIREAGNARWCLHLSYIKPHWPYIAPAPYHALYGRDQVVAPCRSPAERSSPHPVYAAFMNHRESRAFSRDEVRETVVPVYMGLIRQIDDEIGRLVAVLKEQGLWTATMIVFTSDHGDYLGDHWLGEKDLFHECSVKIPLIVRDPSTRADISRGTVERRLVEAIDVVPTLVEAAGGKPRGERLEGRSLMPFLTGARAPGWRDHVVSEYDFAMREAAGELGVEPAKARIWMVRTTRWKYLYYEGFRPQLFDLETDPRELTDLGTDPMMEKTRAEMREKLFAWMRGLKRRVTVSDETIRAASGKAHEQGILIGWWDERG
jgi:arylsulfatase A-like enzyme